MARQEGYGIVIKVDVRDVTVQQGVERHVRVIAFLNIVGFKQADRSSGRVFVFARRGERATGSWSRENRR
jgi:hypothetical protein